MIAPLDIQDKYYWNKWTADIGKPIYEKGCCTLAVLSNVEIDSAKRSFDCNTSSELKKIRKEIGDKDYELLECYTSWLDTKDKDKYITPEIKPGATIKGFKILGLDPMGYLIEVISEKEERVKKSLCRKTINDYNFIANLLREKDIKDSNSNCEKSLQQCLKALVECNDYLQKQQIAGNNNKYIKRNYAKDYQEINACFHTIDNIFNKATVSVDALLWRLIELEKNSSRLIKNFTNSSSNYVIVDSASNEYKIAKKEKKTHTCPHALLFSALFLAGFDDKTINEAYLTKRL